MPFKKGNTQGKGRPKGSKNLLTLEKQGLINYLKEEGRDRFLLELNKLHGSDYCDQYTKIIEIAFPKLARVEQALEGDINVSLKWEE